MYVDLSIYSYVFVLVHVHILYCILGSRSKLSEWQGSYFYFHQQKTGQKILELNGCCDSLVYLFHAKCKIKITNMVFEYQMDIEKQNKRALMAKWV